MPSFCSINSPRIVTLLTAQENFRQAHQKAVYQPTNVQILEFAKAARAIFESHLGQLELSIEVELVRKNMREIIRARAQNFDLNPHDITLVPEYIPTPEVSFVDVNRALNILGGQEAWRVVTRPTAADFKRMCQWTDPATGNTHDWHLELPYVKMFFPRFLKEFDQIQELYARRSSSFDRLTNASIFGSHFGNFPLYTKGQVYLRSIYVELLQQETESEESIIFIDTAKKPEYTTIDFEDGFVPQYTTPNHNADMFLVMLREIIDKDPSFSETKKALLRDRFSKSYVQWEEELLPRINRIIQAEIDRQYIPITVALSLASFIDTQYYYLLYPESTSSNTKDLTLTRLANQKDQLEDEVLFAGAQGHGGLSCADDLSIAGPESLLGCRLALTLKAKDA